MKKCNQRTKKTASNNQWAGAKPQSGPVRHGKKTATDNQWISTNKTVEADDYN